MPIPLPNLDDRSYADLTAQAQALLPSLYPDWTDYNPSDPGITLVELLAWLTEMLLFQVNEVTPDSIENFLKLLNGPGWSRPDTVSQHDAITATMLGLREIYRAVTPGDYEWLIMNTWPGTSAAVALPGSGKIARVRCVPRRDLSATDPAVRSAEAQAHVSLVVLPGPELAGSEDALHAALWQFFDERRLLTTRHHVVGPGYVPVEISANLALRDDAPPQQALSAARGALAAHFDPLTGGPQHTGWPFGRAVYESEASAVLVEQVPALAYVENVQVTSPGHADRVQTGDTGQPVAVLLDAGELVQLGTTALVAYDSLGHSYSQT
jgi:hypothetical protein